MEAKFDTDFENPVLLQIMQAFQKRRKALRRKSSIFSVSRLQGDDAQEGFDEALMLEFSTEHLLDGAQDQLRLQVKVWSDRWVTIVGYNRFRKERQWLIEYSGRIYPELGAVKFQNEVEIFWDGICNGKYKSISTATAYWKDKLIDGPIGLAC